MEVTHTRHGNSPVRYKVQCLTAPVGKLWLLETVYGKGKRGVRALSQLAQNVQLISEGQQGNTKKFKWKKT